MLTANGRQTNRKSGADDSEIRHTRSGNNSTKSQWLEKGSRWAAPVKESQKSADTQFMIVGELRRIGAHN
jgi:hypothetical protein